MLDSPAWQMRWKSATSVRPSLALFLLAFGFLFSLVAGGRFWFFFFSFRGRIAGSFLLGYLLTRFPSGLGNSSVQLLGINLLGTEPKRCCL